jgi:DNA polymerase-3 subunit epsilon
MKLNLTRPIAFFDLETTGTQPTTDCIVEIAIHKVHPQGAPETYVRRINPGMPIPAAASAVHGIYDKDVIDAPRFKDLAPEIKAFLDNTDLAGFNSNRFDIPLLVEEFLRIGMDFDMENRRTIDILHIYHKMEQRNLAAAYKFYCGKELTNAHQAEADVIATYEVALAQLEKYETLKNDIDYLHSFTSNESLIDFGGRFLRVNGVELFNFGKHKGRSVKDVLKNEPTYYNWMMEGDFPLHTKKTLKDLKQKYFGK